MNERGARALRRSATLMSGERNYTGETMNPLMKLIPKLHVALYRATRGELGGKMMGLGVVLLTTVGAKTGKRRTTPVAFVRREGGYLVIASNGGQPHHPAWYVNQKKTGTMHIQIMDREMDVDVTDLTGEAYEQAWKDVLAVAPAYGDYKKKTTRRIPILLLKER